VLLIRNGSVIDPVGGTIEKRDIWISNGMISDKLSEKAEIIEADGLYVSPGLVDIHVHFRQPGFEYKEDILSGTKAAAPGALPPPPAWQIPIL
jgi:dihydroorotase